MSHRRPAGASIPRVESDILAGRSSTGVNGNSDRTSGSFLTSASSNVSRQADRARDAAGADAKASRGGASVAPGLSLDATIKRVQESWEATRASEMKSSPGNAASRDAHAGIQRMKGLNRTSAASSHLGKRSSSGAYEDVLERKRRALEDGRNASGRHGLSTPVSDGGSEEASPRRSVPTAGIVNGTSANKPQDEPQVLRAVRSATNKPLSPALRGAEAKTARPQLLEKTASGRPYKVYKDHEGKMTTTAGALIPDGYERYDDDAFAFICPVRSCRKLYRNMIALGAHFGAGHRLVNLNDNGDGTLSIVGQFKASSGGPITARVVSRKRLDPSEPPMPTPKPPGLVRPITTARNDSPPPVTEKMATAASRRSSRVHPPAVDSGESSSAASWSPSPVRSPAPTPDVGTKVMPHLRAVLPPSFDFGLFTVCKEGPLLLQLPIKRHLTLKWIERITSLKTRSQRCVVAMLLFLTGTPAENPCPSCVTSDSGDQCIVPSESFPPFVIERFEGSCAACFYRCNRWHQKNQCLLRNREPTAAERRKAGLEFLLAGLEEDDTPSIDDELVESEAPRPEMSEQAKEAIENEALAYAELFERASKNRTRPFKRPGCADGTSERHTQLELSPPQPPTLAPPQAPSQAPPQPPTAEPYVTSPTRESQGASTHGALLNQGNLMPADTLEMEDWEIAPGAIRNTSDEPDNIAFSNAYLFSNMAVPVAPGIAFNVITLKPGGRHKFPAQQSLRLCSLATGKLSVRMEQESGDVGFQIGPNGMFKVYPGTVASVRNRLYIDAVLHISTVDSSNA